IDSKSGVSGAGRGLGLMYHYGEANENLSAYALGGHRHLPEMTQEFRAFAPGSNPRITFIPHLAPMPRGILPTCYAPLKAGCMPASRPMFPASSISACCTPNVSAR